MGPLPRTTVRKRASILIAAYAVTLVLLASAFVYAEWMFWLLLLIPLIDIPAAILLALEERDSRSRG